MWFVVESESFTQLDRGGPIINEATVLHDAMTYALSCSHHSPHPNYFSAGTIDLVLLKLFTIQLDNMKFRVQTVCHDCFRLVSNVYWIKHSTGVGGMCSAIWAQHIKMQQKHSMAYKSMRITALLVSCFLHDITSPGAIYSSLSHKHPLSTLFSSFNSDWHVYTAGHGASMIRMPLMPWAIKLTSTLIFP